MNTSMHPTPLPSEQDARLARTCSRNLSVVLSSHAETQQFHFTNDQGETLSVELPTSVVRLMVDILMQIGQGNAISIIPIHAELTTQEAADLLNISRPHFVQLLERKEIPFRKVNTHRRVRYDDVMAYKDRVDAARDKTLNEFKTLSHAMGLE
ncbi:helix-turn-helix domain-containing protein [Paraburkholderia fungorum]|uniref:helix-turn-helix domain-containing protein n=1 Tax=Paraburkholderia fungorum TaxID=134537 RepID=UPI0038BA7C40